MCVGRVRVRRVKVGCGVCVMVGVSRGWVRRCVRRGGRRVRAGGRGVERRWRVKVLLVMVGVGGGGGVDIVGGGRGGGGEGSGGD